MANFELICSTALTCAALRFPPCVTVSKTCRNCWGISRTGRAGNWGRGPFTSLRTSSLHLLEDRGRGTSVLWKTPFLVRFCMLLPRVAPGEPITVDTSDIGETQPRSNPAPASPPLAALPMEEGRTLREATQEYQRKRHSRGSEIRSRKLGPRRHDGWGCTAAISITLPSGWGSVDPATKTTMVDELPSFRGDLPFSLVMIAVMGFPSWRNTGGRHRRKPWPVCLALVIIALVVAYQWWERDPVKDLHRSDQPEATVAVSHPAEPVVVSRGPESERKKSSDASIRVRGQVVDRQDRPLPQARVFVLAISRDLIASVVADEFGAFELEVDERERLFLRAIFPGYQPGQLLYDPADGESPRIVLEPQDGVLVDNTSIYGSVRPAAVGAFGVAVLTSRRGSNSFALTMGTKEWDRVRYFAPVDGEGRFEIRKLPAETPLALVVLGADDWVPTGPMRLLLKPGERRLFDVDMVRASTIRLTVRHADAQLFESALTVTLRELSGELVCERRMSVLRGKAEVTGLPAGEFELFCTGWSAGVVAQARLAVVLRVGETEEREILLRARGQPNNDAGDARRFQRARLVDDVGNFITPDQIRTELGVEPFA